MLNLKKVRGPAYFRVYVHRLKKVTHASRESIRILSEIFEEPPQKFPALSGDGKCCPRRVRLPPETVGKR